MMYGMVLKINKILHILVNMCNSVGVCEYICVFACVRKRERVCVHTYVYTHVFVCMCVCSGKVISGLVPHGVGSYIVSWLTCDVIGSKSKHGTLKTTMGVDITLVSITPPK